MPGKRELETLVKAVGGGHGGQGKGGCFCMGKGAQSAAMRIVLERYAKPRNVCHRRADCWTAVGADIK